MCESTSRNVQVRIYKLKCAGANLHEFAGANPRAEMCNSYIHIAGKEERSSSPTIQDTKEKPFAVKVFHLD